jgi:16S rRNA (adenine1518-N6/adenine1519-N6)-dimethyltransferase
MKPPRILFLACLVVLKGAYGLSITQQNPSSFPCSSSSQARTRLFGWVQRDDGEWEWEEDDPAYVPPTITTTPAASDSGPIFVTESSATPKLPAGSFRPKQSLGQNFLRDGNTVAKIIRAFHKDATKDGFHFKRIIELGPGAGALTDPLVQQYGTDVLQCIEVDPRSVELLEEKHPDLVVHYADVLQVDYPEMAKAEGQPLVVIGNLPYYITSQILFALADASHENAVHSATVTMQWEVAQRMVADTRTKDYGILSVVFQLYADVHLHFKIPPTVFYPQPKVDSGLVGLHFLGPTRLRQRLAGVDPSRLRKVVTTAFQQRRKTVRNSLKKLAREVSDGDADRAQALLGSPPLPLPEIVQEARQRGDNFAANQKLPQEWASKRPEELTPGQFVELTRLFFGPAGGEMNESIQLGTKIWRKLKHGTN